VYTTLIFIWRDEGRRILLGEEKEEKDRFDIRTIFRPIFIPKVRERKHLPIYIVNEIGTRRIQRVNKYAIAILCGWI